MKKRLIITNTLQMHDAIVAAGVTDIPGTTLLCTTRSPIEQQGRMLAFDRQLDDSLPDVPRGARGNKLWRSQDLPVVPKSWECSRVPKDAAPLSEAIAAIKHADEVIHAGTPERAGQHAIDELLEVAGVDPNRAKRLWLADGSEPDDVLEGFEDLRDNSAGRLMTAAVEAFYNANWVVSVNLKMAWTIANKTWLVSPGRLNLAIAAHVAKAGGRIPEADVIEALGAGVIGRDSTESALSWGFVSWELLRGVPQLVLDHVGQAMIEALGLDHPLCQIPRDGETLGAIESGVLRPDDWLAQEIEFVREQIPEARELPPLPWPAGPAQH